MEQRELSPEEMLALLLFSGTAAGATGFAANQVKQGLNPFQLPKRAPKSSPLAEMIRQLDSVYGRDASGRMRQSGKFSSDDVYRSRLDPQTRGVVPADMTDQIREMVAERLDPRVRGSIPEGAVVEAIAEQVAGGTRGGVDAVVDSMLSTPETVLAGPSNALVPVGSARTVNEAVGRGRRYLPAVRPPVDGSPPWWVPGWTDALGEELGGMGRLGRAGKSALRFGPSLGYMAGNWMSGDEDLDPLLRGAGGLAAAGFLGREAAEGFAMKRAEDVVKKGGTPTGRLAKYAPLADDASRLAKVGRFAGKVAAPLGAFALPYELEQLANNLGVDTSGVEDSLWGQLLRGGAGGAAAGATVGGPIGALIGAPVGAALDWADAGRLLPSFLKSTPSSPEQSTASSTDDPMNNIDWEGLTALITAANTMTRPYIDRQQSYLDKWSERGPDTPEFNVLQAATRAIPGAWGQSLGAHALTGALAGTMGSGSGSAPLAAPTPGN